MRGIMAVSLLSAGAALAGCQAEADERAALTKAAIEECVRGFDSSSAERPGMVPQDYETRRICTCSWERAGRDRSIEQLRAMSRGEEAAPELVDAMGACLVQEAQRTGVLSR